MYGIKLGDIISFGVSIGHVDYIGSDHYTVNAYVIGDIEKGDFHIKRFRVPILSSNLGVVDDETAERFRKALYSFGYMIWKDDSIVDTPHITYWGWMCDEGGIGVFLLTGYDPETDVMDYLAFKGYDIVKGSIEPWNRFVRNGRAGECREGEMRLAVNGLQVDYNNRRMLRYNKRAEVGGVYWYITDRFSVRTARDMRTPVHDERYNVLNYFLTPDEAKNAIRYLTDYLRPTSTAE